MLRQCGSSSTAGYGGLTVAKKVEQLHSVDLAIRGLPSPACHRSSTEVPLAEIGGEDHLTDQLLERGDIVVGTVRKPDSVADVTAQYPDAFRGEVLDVRDTAAVRDVVSRTATEFSRIDVAVSNTGYGVFGAAEELSDEQINGIIATNLTGSIQLIRAVLPHMRAAGQGRIVQLSSYGGTGRLPR